MLGGQRVGDTGHHRVQPSLPLPSFPGRLSRGLPLCVERIRKICKVSTSDDASEGPQRHRLAPQHPRAYHCETRDAHDHSFPRLPPRSPRRLRHRPLPVWYCTTHLRCPECVKFPCRPTSDHCRQRRRTFPDEATMLVALDSVALNATMAMVWGAHAQMRVVLVTLFRPDHPTPLEMKELNS